MYDYIVIGSGSSGSAVAGRLSEDSATTVLVLEAGGSDKRLPILMPAATYLKAIGNPKYDWRYKAAADPTRNGRKDYMPRGKVLGGSSSINGMCYVRGQREDFDDWAAQGCDGWSFDEILPYYKTSERNENGWSAFHGGSGPLAVSNIRDKHPISDAFLTAAGNVGFRVTDDINVPPQDGIGYIQATQKNGWRCSASRAYLWPATRRSNIDILTHARASKIVFDGRRASGVEYMRNGRRHVVGARYGVIVSAGAIASPQLLMLSGIGPANQLKKYGIDVILDAPGVGQNFHDHPGASISVEVNAKTYNMMNSLWQHLYLGCRWLLTGSGPGSTPDAHVIGFARSNDEIERSDLQFHFTPAGYDLAENGPILLDRPAVTAYANVQRPFSRGSISLQSGNYLDQPIIQPNLFGDQRDLKVLIAGLKKLRVIFEAQPISGFVVNELAPGDNVNNDNEWEAYIREAAMGIYHPAGTCKMGADDLSVVDSRLRVKGVENLFVADASIMPNIVSGNLNATCMVIGEKCADIIKARAHMLNRHSAKVVDALG